MIRRIEHFAIGLALIGSLTPSSFGQVYQRQVAIPVQAQPVQVAAPVQVQPVQVQPVQVQPVQVQPVQVQPVQAQPVEAAAPAATAMTEDEKALRHTLGAYVAAYNQKDAAKLVEFFTPDGTLIDSDNVATRGRDAITQEFSEAFAHPSSYTLEGKVERIHMITPDVAQVEGVSRLVSPKEATIANHFVALLARQGNAWKLAEIRDYPEPGTSVTPYERLKELEWMVGDWVDETEGAQVSSTVQWGQGKGYLVRNYSAQIKDGPANSGLIIIAWDPQSEQIKSWIFSADGSRGEGSWTRAEDNQWVVKIHGTTGDGRPNSATQILSMVNKDAVRAKSIDRIVGGEIAPDVEEVIMVRKPPAPSTATAPASASTAPPTQSAN